MKLFVPDASIILKWVLSENANDQDKALSLLHGWLNQECAFILPSLWMYEVGNVLGLKMKVHRGITFYDAVYHAVAVQESGTLVTADKTYFDKMQSKGGIVLI
jgi:predicted nucleic acid-binding protein